LNESWARPEARREVGAELLLEDPEEMELSTDVRRLVAVLLRVLLGVLIPLIPRDRRVGDRDECPAEKKVDVSRNGYSGSTRANLAVSANLCSAKGASDGGNSISGGPAPFGTGDENGEIGEFEEDEETEEIVEREARGDKRESVAKRSRLRVTNK